MLKCLHCPKVATATRKVGRDYIYECQDCGRAYLVRDISDTIDELDDDLRVMADSDIQTGPFTKVDAALINRSEQ